MGSIYRTAFWTTVGVSEVQPAEFKLLKINLLLNVIGTHYSKVYLLIMFAGFRTFLEGIHMNYMMYVHMSHGSFMCSVVAMSL